MSGHGIFCIVIAVAKDENARYVENACYWMNVLALKTVRGDTRLIHRLGPRCLVITHIDLLDLSREEELAFAKRMASIIEQSCGEEFDEVFAVNYWRTDVVKDLRTRLSRLAQRQVRV